MSHPTPDHIISVAIGYGVSKILLTAVGLGLFTRLAQAPMKLDQIIDAYGLVRRPAMDMLDLLVSVDLLEREGQGDTARYSNTPATAKFLNKASPDYLGGLIELWENRNFRYWADIDVSLRTGRAVSEAREDDEDFFGTLYSDPDRLESFLDAMTGASARNFEMLAKVFPFEKFSSMADIGGADALLSRIVAAAHPNLRIKTFDLPVVTEVARRKIEATGFEDRIIPMAGDFFEDPLPAADVITMGMILHDWNLERKLMLLRKAYEALPDGGVLIAIEALIDDERRTNTFALFMSLTMAMEFGDAFDFSFSEFRGWCEEVGFRRFEAIPLVGPSTAAIAHK
ncbi:methyltransferase [Bauldia sp.]|uniref:methyltransferase n=1 Tax=Bauldia sp. TaxID=2575872 RepID=UPI003BAA2170